MVYRKIFEIFFEKGGAGCDWREIRSTTTIAYARYDIRCLLLVIPTKGAKHPRGVYLVRNKRDTLDSLRSLGMTGGADEHCSLAKIDKTRDEFTKELFKNY